tara:strand:+ start:102 stop:587 length:486 start_codon:yes stop_codon:yes gene_type:complete
MNKIILGFIAAGFLSGCSVISEPNLADTTESADKNVVVTDSMTDHFKGKGVMRSTSIYFEIDSTLVPSDYNNVIAHIKQAVSHDPELKVIIHAHADKTGDREYNTKLSKKRADSVLARLNLSEDTYRRISLDFFGEDEPRCESDSEVGLSCNRRVDVYLLK